MLREFGADADWSSGDTISVQPRPYKSGDYFIESDWSGASYWYVMAALSRDRDATIHLSGLTDGSKQGDSVVKYIFSLLGVKTIFETREEGCLQMVTLKKSGRCVPRLEYDFVNSPDLAQTVVATCCALGVKFHFRGLSTLKIKETDRIEALKTEMLKIGCVLKDVDGRELIWDGTRVAVAAEVPVIDTYDDHRMALAFAPYALVTEGLTINNPHVVTKSYPRYWDDMKKAGFEIEVL
jgi:3-phosphoshikimate 1-carboxyvinyltransferase